MFPPAAPLAVAPLLVNVISGPPATVFAAALLVNTIVPKLPAPSVAVTKFGLVAELFVGPTPLMVNVNVGLAVMVNALAPELNTMPLTSVFAESETLVILEVAKVAVSDAPLGTVVGVQFVAVFQSPVAGLAFHVALPAKLLLAVESRRVRMAAAERRKAHARVRRGEGGAPKSGVRCGLVFFMGFSFSAVLFDLKLGDYCTVRVRSLPVPPS